MLIAEGSVTQMVLSHFSWHFPGIISGSSGGISPDKSALGGFIISN